MGQEAPQIEGKHKHTQCHQNTIQVNSRDFTKGQKKARHVPAMPAITGQFDQPQNKTGIIEDAADDSDGS